jgi:N utilization substance protein A
VKLDLLPILRQLENERQINEDVLIEAVRSAIEMASRKTLHHLTDIDVHVDNKKLEITVYERKRVVDVVSNDAEEMTLPEALEIDPEAEIGGEVKVETTLKDFGRIAAQTAKQVIRQRIREAERHNIFEEFKAKEGKVLTGFIKRHAKGNLLVDVGRAEGVLPHKEQPPREMYRYGDRLKAYVLSVEKTPRGPQIVLSRSAPELVLALFELEVPEVFDGTIEIRGVAREPGYRTKIAVSSRDSNVDPVGACVGMKGMRVKAVMDELGGEKIDIIRWDPSPAVYLSNALSPASIMKVEVDEEARIAYVVAAQDQLSLAIGKRGQNARLAAKLTGWQITIEGEQDKAEVAAAAKAAETEPSDTDAARQSDLTQLSGVGKQTAQILVNAGYETVRSVSEAEPEKLSQLEGIGSKLADKIIQSAKELV